MGYRCIQAPAAVMQHVGTGSAVPERTRFVDQYGTGNRMARKTGSSPKTIHRVIETRYGSWRVG